MTIDYGQQIADAEREFSHGNACIAFRRLAAVTAHMLGRIDALEAAADAVCHTLPRPAPHRHEYELHSGKCIVAGCEASL